MSLLFPSTSDYIKSRKSEWTFSDDVLPGALVFDMSINYGGSVVSSPIEEGSFFSYNKTTEPMQVNATLSFVGSDTYLQSVLDRLYTLKNSVTMFSINTPMYEFENMNLESYSFDLKREDGRGVLYVKANFIEIREITVSYENTNISEEQSKDVSAVSTVQGGLKQAQNPTSLQQTAGEASKEKVKQKRDIVQDIMDVWGILG